MFPVRDKNSGLTKYVARSKATVLDNKDPLKRGRVRVDHPLIGQTGWIPYLRTNSTFDPPEIGDVVYVESDSGLYNYPVAHGNLTKGLSGGSSSLQDIFQRNVPTNRGWSTPQGNSIELDDGPAVGSGDSGAKGIRLTSVDGNSIAINDDFSFIEFKDIGGNSITLQYGQGGIIGIVVNSAKNVHITSAQDTTIEASGLVNITASSSVTLEAPHIDLGAAAAESVVKGDTFKSLYDAHTHTGNLGAPTSPPITPLSPSALSTKVKTE